MMSAESNARTTGGAYSAEGHGRLPHDLKELKKGLLKYMEGTFHQSNFLSFGYVSI